MRPTSAAPSTTRYAIPPSHWRIAGALGLAHVVLIPVGIALQRSPLFADGVGGIRESYVAGDFTRSVSGWMLEAFGFLLLVPALVFLARALGRRSESGRWAAQTGLMCGLGYVAVTFAVGFPAGAAAMYGAQHGLDLDTAFAINNLRIFSYFLSLMLLAGGTLGIAVSALADGEHRRWIGGFGIVTGVGLLVSTPLSLVELQDLGTLVWMVWFVGVCVLMLRHRETAGTEAVTGLDDSAHSRVRVGQA
ncbi:MAG TPA: hypothetical protein VFJ28_02400 [Marmoricola sp.]|nr:hypothetical protein [Marmoricola sp.]